MDDQPSSETTTTAAAAAAAPVTTATNESAPATTTTGSEKQPTASTSSAGEEEQVEIKVEEGYATRQMDEYFRQTIAAIKEELTKKLETKEAAEAEAAKIRHRFDSGSGEFDEDDDMVVGGADRVELGTAGCLASASGVGGISGVSGAAAGVIAKDDYYCAKCRENLSKQPRNNRAYIYQNLMGKFFIIYIYFIFFDF